MRINVSTIFKIVSLFIQDVVAYEAEQESLATPQSKVETPVAIDSQTPTK